MEKYGTPFFGVDRITSDLCAMEATFMTLISEMATIMPQVSTLVGVTSHYPSEALSPPLMAHNNITLQTAKSTQVPQPERVVMRNKEKGVTAGNLLSITSHLSSTSSGLASIDLTQKTLDEESREKLKGKIKWQEI